MFLSRVHVRSACFSPAEGHSSILVWITSHYIWAMCFGLSTCKNFLTTSKQAHCGSILYVPCSAFFFFKMKTVYLYISLFIKCVSHIPSKADLRHTSCKRTFWYVNLQIVFVKRFCCLSANILLSLWEDNKQSGQAVTVPRLAFQWS